MRRASLLLVVVIAAAVLLVGPSPAAQARPCDFYRDPVDCIYPPDPNPIPPLPSPPAPPCDLIWGCPIPPVPPCNGLPGCLGYPLPPCNSVATCVGDPSTGASSQLVETMAVLANDANGTLSQQPLLAGRTYTFVASGTFRESSTGAIADAECTATTSDPTWQTARYGTAPDRLDLTINGAEMTWIPADTSSPCDDGTHVYTVVVPVTNPTYVRAAVADTAYNDNIGALKLTILLTGIGPVPFVPHAGPRAPGNRLLDVIEVDSRSPSGAASSISLETGLTYVWKVNGTYVYEPGGARADGECSQPVGDVDGEFVPDRFPDSVLEMLINTFDPPWTPSTINNKGCDLGHSYQWVTPPAINGPVLFRVKELSNVAYKDNVGILTVSIYAVS
ncbi:MAG TPA: hypothetical protein VMY34_06380 [Acidimicrobiales bacterium]|nr:hypothetical protein [Acidimicrobiales bacterium]